jgi:hypothetical protein
MNCNKSHLAKSCNLLIAPLGIVPNMSRNKIEFKKGVIIGDRDSLGTQIGTTTLNLS